MSASPVEREPLMLARALRRQKQSLRRATVPTAAERRDALAALRHTIHAHRFEIADSIHADFGNRSPAESLLLEVNAVLGHARYMARNLEAWIKHEPKPIAWPFKPAAGRVEYAPAGVVGILSPWNYPLALSLVPLVTALAAGNRVMLKPSEHTPRTSALIADLLARIYPADQVHVVQGDARTGAAFASLDFDHVVFTGSTAVGREIMRAAARHLVPVTLELGGKSPALLDRDVDLRRAARRIAYGKLINAGQTCMAPDYALVPQERVDEFVGAFGDAVATLYPAIASNRDYTTIATDAHFARLESLVSDAQARGARIVGLDEQSGDRLHERTFVPALVLDVSEPMTIMREEIFGPLLPLVAYRDLDDALELIASKPKPLTLYLFSHRRDFLRAAIARTSTGSVACNETIMHYAQWALPFGGVGDSGMGVYHGHEGFKRLSHARSVFEQRRLNLVESVYPPYGRRFKRLLERMLRS